MAKGSNIFVGLVALRYLFAKKRHNTINLITWVSMTGVAVGTMALICVLSVMNGFERVITESFTAFDPELRITPARGVYFAETDPAVEAAREAMPDAVWSSMVEMDGLIGTPEGQSPVKVRGVDGEFSRVTGIDSMMWSGVFAPEYDSHYGLQAAVGVGLATRVHCYADRTTTMALYSPKRRRVNVARPETNFNKTEFVCNGLFCVQQTVYDDNYVILPIDAVREAYEIDSEYVSAIALRLSADRHASDREIARAATVLSEILGEEYVVADRYRQQSDFYRISRIEKWTTFMIMCFIILIATFNIVGSLSMIIIDKADDIDLMTALGATQRQIRRLFVAEGCLISLMGFAIGAVVGVALVVVQQEFGVLTLGTGYITQVYPVQLLFTDIILVVAAVTGMGMAAAAYATKITKRENIEAKIEH